MDVCLCGLDKQIVMQGAPKVVVLLDHLVVRLAALLFVKRLLGILMGDEIHQRLTVGCRTLLVHL